MMAGMSLIEVGPCKRSAAEFMPLLESVDMMIKKQRKRYPMMSAA